MNPLRSKRLIIYPLTADELREKLLSEKDEDTKTAYREMLSASREHPEFAQWYTVWEIDLYDGTAVGSLCFMGPPVCATVGIGCAIDDDHRGNDYASEALNAACEWAFSHNGVTFVSAAAAPGSASSLAAVEKAGFVTVLSDDGDGALLMREREKPIFAATISAVGLALGSAYGLQSGRIAIGMGIGLCAGLAVGLFLDIRERQRRKELKELYVSSIMLNAEEKDPPA